MLRSQRKRNSFLIMFSYHSGYKFNESISLIFFLLPCLLFNKPYYIILTVLCACADLNDTKAILIPLTNSSV